MRSRRDPDSFPPPPHRPREASPSQSRVGERAESTWMRDFALLPLSRCVIGVTWPPRVREGALPSVYNYSREVLSSCSNVKYLRSLARRRCSIYGSFSLLPPWVLLEKMRWPWKLAHFPSWAFSKAWRHSISCGSYSPQHSSGQNYFPQMENVWNSCPPSQQAT